MALKKEGELRVRKGESIYGPMTRADFDRLLAGGRFSLADFVSVWGGPWIEIIRFLAAAEGGADDDAPAPKPLRVLRGEHLFGSLDHQQVSQLHRDGRIADDDLVCAIGGPWMPVADFLSPHRSAAPPDADPSEVEPSDDEPEAEWEYVPLRWYHAYAGDLEEQLSDQWFVRVKGIHSAPLTRQQVRQLVAAGEITSRNVARHFTWHEEDWKPIYSIAELAGAMGL